MCCGSDLGPNEYLGPNNTPGNNACVLIVSACPQVRREQRTLERRMERRTQGMKNKDRKTKGQGEHKHRWEMGRGEQEKT